MLKWDVKSFIAHKRDSLPIFALQKLKDAVLEGSHSVFVSLKERSGVEVRTQFNDIPGLGFSPSASGKILEMSNKDIQIARPNENSCHNTAENEAEKLQEKLPDRNSLLSKRKKIDISAENLEREDQIMQDNCYDQHAASAKKFKQGTHVTENTAVQKLIKSVRGGLLANFSERITKDIDREGYNLENETEIGGMDMRHTEYPFDAAENLKRVVNVTEHAIVVKSFTAAGDDPLPNSTRRTTEHTNREGCNLEKEAEIRGMDTSHSDSTYVGGQLQDPMNDNIEVNIPVEVQGRNNCADEVNDQMKVFEEKASNGASLGAKEDHDNVNEAIHAFHKNVQGNTSSGCEANDGIEHNQVLEAAIDHDNFHDERNDIASKKKAFLASQCSFSEDSLATEPIFCMKCYRGGQLLTCGSSTCPLVVHESCLGTAAKFDGDGIFYCPFCMYFRAISECLEAKKKATLARKDLATFMDQKVTCPPQLPRRSRRLKQNKVRRVDEIFENNEANIDRDPLDEVVHTHMRPNVEENLQAKPSTSVAVSGLPSGQTAAHLTHGEPEILENENLHGEGKGQQCQSPIQPGEEQNEVHAPQKYDSDISSHKQAGILQRNGRWRALVAANDIPSGQTVAHSTHGEPEILGNENLHGERMEQPCQSPIRPREKQNQVQATQKSDSAISSQKQADVPRRSRRQAGTRLQKKVKQPPESYLPSEPLNQTTSESSEEDVDKSSSLKYSMRSRRPEMQYTYPAIPMIRRKRCRWTKLEEDKLKEGVEKLSNHQDFSIPWKAILEFGAGVFEKGRTTVDLKDKWRNMCKGVPKSN